MDDFFTVSVMMNGERQSLAGEYKSVKHSGTLLLVLSCEITSLSSECLQKQLLINLKQFFSSTVSQCRKVKPQEHSTGK